MYFTITNCNSLFLTDPNAAEMNIIRFKNVTSVPIETTNPNTITSSLSVSGIESKIKFIRVKLNIIHSYTDDLSISIISPNGERLNLVNSTGGSGDNFIETIFDDLAQLNISEAQAPFTGTFRPNESLSLFENKDANGEWILEIRDQAFQDGGSLLDWELTVETVDSSNLPLIFNNMTAVPISSGPANTVSSQIIINGHDDLSIDQILVTIDITHSYTNDLDISLSHDDGTVVKLVSFVGGSGDNFKTTNFDDSASDSIQNASPPFTGTFKPTEQLSLFKGKQISGLWTLTIRDNANLDGGSLNFWKLCIFTNETPIVPSNPYTIDVRFIGGLTVSQQLIFQAAADRWSEVITGDLESFEVEGEIIDDLLILAEGTTIDGPNGILGQAGPTHLRPDSRIPIKGIMNFDSADLQSLEDEGELLDVIIHEMGHVIGIGTIWSELGLIESSGTNNPLFIGLAAMKEYGALTGTINLVKVPVANTGGAGTREGHWREATFDTELMTGFDDPGRNALSRLTVASLQDLGYQVNIDAADNYSLPLRQLILDEIEAKTQHRCMVEFPPTQIVSKQNRVV